MNPPVLAADLRRRWEATLGAQVEDTSLSASATYRPPWGCPPASPAAPERGFELQDELGRGGMGVVHRARQASLRRAVAMKGPLPGNPQPGSRERFLAEAWLTGLLEHPNIVPVYDLEWQQDCPRLAMKLVAGQPWKALLDEQPDALERHLEILLQVGNALAYAHSRGVVHLDLKPSNVMLGEFGEVLLMDWGLAVALENRPGTGLRSRFELDAPCGTPAYLPPELAAGKGTEVGIHTDVYLLGAVLCEILSGRPPHRGDTLLQVLVSALRATQPEFAPELPRQLVETCRRALQAEPGKRHPDVPSFQAELRAFLQHRESLRISERARKQLRACREAAEGQQHASHSLYEAFAEAVAGFKQARLLWPENHDAEGGEQEAREAYAEAALRQRDLGLAEAQAAQLEDPQRSALLQRVARDKRERARSQRSRRWLAGGLLAAVASLIIALVLGIVAVAAQRDRAAEHAREIAAAKTRVEEQKAEVEREKQRVQRQKDWAEQRGGIAEEALIELQTRVQRVLHYELGDARARQAGDALLRQALSSWEKLRASSYASNRVSRGTAQALLKIASLRLSFDGDADGAQELCAEAVAIIEALYAADPSADLLREWAVAFGQQSTVFAQAGALQQAVAGAERAVQLHRELFIQAGSLQTRDDLVQSLSRFGELLRTRGARTKAIAVHQEVLDHLQVLLAANPVPRLRQTLLRTHLWLGMAQWEKTAPEAARGHFETALELAREQRARHPLSAEALGDLCVALKWAAKAWGLQGERSASLAGLTELVQLRGELAASEQSARADRYLGRALIELANEQARAADSQANSQLERAAALLHPLLEAEPDDVGLLSDLAETEAGLGLLLLAEARELGIARLRQAVDLRRRAWERDPDIAASAAFLSRDLFVLGAELSLDNLLDEAVLLYAEGIQLRRQLLAGDPESFEHRRILAMCLQQWGELEGSRAAFAASEALYHESLELLRPLQAVRDDDHELFRLLFVALQKLQQLREHSGEEALALLLEMEERSSARLARDPDNAELRTCQLAARSARGGWHESQGQLEEAAAAYEQALQSASALAEAYPDNPNLRRNCAVVQVQRARNAEQRGDWELAWTCLQDAQRIAQSLVDLGSQHAQEARILAEMLEALRQRMPAED